MRTRNNTMTAPILTETISIRLSEAECRALVAIAQRGDRTISYVVRNLVRRLLQEPPR